MRLLHSKTHELRDFVENEAKKVEYAILSHTWELEEVTFQDLRSWLSRYTRKLGWKKIEYCCMQARQDGIDWIWMDTVCIDKSSSAELSEAINSMFTWYLDARVCYAYLADIPAARWSARDHYSCLQDSRWFSRGWTLQELLAPKQMILYGTDWNQLGTRDELSDLISQVSGIQVSALQGDEKEIDKFSIAQRMCWASRRETTRSEDIAYCLLGLFDVNMPLLYGEGGKKAFIRLQEEIMKNSDDHTLFAWTVPEEVRSRPGVVKEVGLLAEHPMFFRSSKDVLSFRRWDISDTFSMTNKGLRITVPLTVDVGVSENWIAYLDCHQLKNGQRCAVGIPLQQLSRGGDQFARVAQSTLDIPLSLEHELPVEKRAIYIRKDIIKPDDAFREEDTHRLQEFHILRMPFTHKLVEKYGSAREGSNSRTLLAPPKTTSYWIDPLAWANWRVVCLFEEQESVYRAQTSSFIVVLGYDGVSAKAWCVVEPYTRQSLRDVWDNVRSGKSDAVNEVLLVERSIVRVELKPAAENPGVVEVDVQCTYGLGDSIDDGPLRDMDPLFIFSGTDGVADICLHLVKSLEDTRMAFSAFRVDSKKNSRSYLEAYELVIGSIYKSIEGFIKDLEALGAANKAIQAVFHKEISYSPFIPEAFWRQTAESLKNCRKAVEELKRVLEEIYRKKPTSLEEVTLLLDSLNMKDKHSKNKQLEQSLEIVSIYHKILHMSLLTAILYENAGGQLRSSDELSREVESSQSQIATMLDVFRLFENSVIRDRTQELATWTAITDLRASVDAAIAAIKLEASNRHFIVPLSTSAIFTGRSELLAELRNILFEASVTAQDHEQRRFIVCGIGGSGKSQFCTKFASENRYRYWGVFWINLSSPERTSETCALIAKVGGVEPTLKAVLHWLSNLKRQYLLILDNADDPSLSISDYFPQGNMGHVLVTTRDPTNRIYGNVSQGYYQLESLPVDDANYLLLKASARPLPWNNHVMSKASTITRVLGYLPLAIVHAGSAIRNGFCTLDTYLDFYFRSFQRIRANKAQRNEQSQGMNHSIYASFEIAFSNISNRDTPETRDAIQLIKVFAFFHHENIQVDILERAIQNPAKEREQQEREEKKERLKELGGKSKRSGWSRTLPLEILRWIFAERTPPVLPDVIRDGQSSPQFDPDRLRSALNELVQTSLIVHNVSHNSDSYSMHPFIHMWVRERPEMSFAEQALWSEAAATMLSCSLLLPQFGNTPEEELFRTTVLPHVQHVLACQRSIRDRISDSSRVISRPSWLLFDLPYTMSRTRAVINMKLSLVLAHGGLFSDAEMLQVQVKDYLLKILGIEHKITRRIMLTLAGTYSNLGQLEKAKNMQNRVLEACKIVLGSNDHETLLTQGALAETLSMQSHYIEAQKLQEEVVLGLTKLKGRRHEDTLVAIDNLGVTIMNLQETLEKPKNVIVRRRKGWK